MAQDSKSKNPAGGEGNHAADARYREETKRFIASGKVEPAADEAKRALENEDEAEELGEAEAAGRARAVEEDPEVSRR